MITQVGGKAGSQSVSRIETGANVVQLSGADRKVAAQAEIDTAAKSHGKSIGAGNGRGDSTQNRDRHTC